MAVTSARSWCVTCGISALAAPRLAAATCAKRLIGSSVTGPYWLWSTSQYEVSPAGPAAGLPASRSSRAMVVRPRSLASFSISMPFSRARARTDGGAMMSLISAPLPTGRDVLRFHELKHAFMPAFTAQARLLHATEGRGGVADQTTVQADHAIVQPLADLQSALHVFREDIGDKAIFGVIGAADHLVLIGEGLDRRNGPEDFVMHAVRILRHVRQNRWRVVEALARGDVAAAFEFCALGDRVGHERGHLVAGIGIDQRPHIDRRIAAIAEFERAHPVGKAFGEFGGDVLVHVDAVRRCTRLAQIAHLGQHGAFDGHVP